MGCIEGIFEKNEAPPEREENGESEPVPQSSNESTCKQERGVTKLKNAGNKNKKKKKKKKQKRKVVDSKSFQSLKKELKRYKKLPVNLIKKIKLIAIDCEDLGKKIRKCCASFKFVKDGEQASVVACIKKSRVQCDAEAAIEQANKQAEIDPGKVILLMFHSVAGSNTVVDVESVMYTEPSVFKTYHVPFTNKVQF